MKKTIIILCSIGIIIGTAVLVINLLNNGNHNDTMREGDDGMSEFKSITMDEAKKIFETPGDYIILDVRRADEFAQGHIPGAINMANESITTTQPKELPDKNQVIYVYCRSGNRSKQAAAKLALMGYTNIVEFGGILDWKGEIIVAK